jgi:hypothetical protein
VRSILGLISCVGLAAADLNQLRELEEKNRFFELRRALEQPGWNENEVLYYRAATAARFGQETAAVQQLHEFLAANPKPEIARKAHEEMAAAFERIGHYADAAREWSDAILLTPKDDSQRSDNENTQRLQDSLRDIAPQTVEFGPEVAMEAKHNQVGTWDVPIKVNGQKGEWIFDTGANLSILIESEAARMGLAIRETTAYVTGSTDKKNTMRLAVGGDVRFGGAHLRNVVFLVLADKALYIGPLHYQIRGILALPVLRALGQVGISAQGRVRIEPKGTVAQGIAQGAPNLFYDELSPIVEIRHNGHWLQMFLDTGANQGVLYPSFRPAMGSDELAKLKSKREKTAGAGGMIKRKTQVVPSVRMEILNRFTDVTKVSLLAAQPTGTLSFRDGVIAMDALSQGFTLDFQRMQLRLE